ncbi:MAG: SGNH/GDSL hydrolase family protein [Vicinamibacterales bacterium]
MSTTRRIATGVFSSALLFATLELVLAAVGFQHRQASPILFWNGEEDERMRHAGSLHRVHPYWFWELRPHAPVPGCAGERINRAGFRGLAREASRTQGLMRIVVLGDSSTFGMGVCAAETYSAVLESSISGIEVLNFGVIGFSAFQGARLFESRSRRYRPDIVLVAFGAVDELLPLMDYDVEAKYLITSRSWPWTMRLSDALFHFRAFQLMSRVVAGRTVRSRELANQTDQNWEAWNRGASDYKRNQTVPSFERSVADIISRANAVHASVVLIVPPRRTTVEERWPWAMEYVAAIRRTSEGSRLPMVDVRAAFRQRSDSDQELFLDAYHPNAVGHRLYAEVLAKSLHERGLIPALRQVAVSLK